MINKSISYFLGINGAVALTTSLVAFSPSSSLKELSLSSKKNVSEEKFSETLALIKDKVELLEVKDNEEEVWNWEPFENGLVIFQKNGGSGFKKFNEKSGYESWRQETNPKTYKEYQEDSFEIFYTVFPLDKLNKKDYSEFLKNIAKEEPRSKIQVMAELVDKIEEFKKIFGEKNYQRLILFIKKFGFSKK